MFFFFNVTHMSCFQWRFGPFCYPLYHFKAYFNFEVGTLRSIFANLGRGCFTSVSVIISG